MTLALREAFLAFRRAPVLSALSVTTIAFALFVVSLVGLVALNLRRSLEGLEERVEVVMFLRRGTPVEVATMAIGDIETFPEVQSVNYVSEEEALERARKELVEFRGVFDDLSTNPLPASLEITLKPGFRDAAHANALEERLGGFRFAEEVHYGRDWVEKLDRLRNIAFIVGSLVGAAFGAASVIIIGTTIRMTVMQRSREIALMRLVGATDGFIRLPFLIEGGLKGALGGGAAVALSYMSFVTVNRLFSAEFFSPAQGIGIVAVGTALGLLASMASVGRHLGNV